MAERFPIVLRGYDKDSVDEALRSTQQTIVRLRQQGEASDKTILQLQAKLQEERSKAAEQGTRYASLFANAHTKLH